jgi:hypothetical protein
MIGEEGDPRHGLPSILWDKLLPEMEKMLCWNFFPPATLWLLSTNTNLCTVYSWYRCKIKSALKVQRQESFEISFVPFPSYLPGYWIFLLVE